jgi:hypothetical protein
MDKKNSLGKTVGPTSAKLMQELFAQGKVILRLMKLQQYMVGEDKKPAIFFVIL